MVSRLRRLFRLASRDAVTLWYAFRHPGSPGMVRLGAVLLALYVLSPIDFIPDWIPVLGWIDDVTLLALGVPALLKLVPAAVLAEAHGATEGLLSRMRLWTR
jgi:uncharacterized membrane protein YkvA (DUF1232 family)